MSDERIGWDWSCRLFHYQDDEPTRGVKLGPLAIFIWRRHLCACLFNRWAIPSVKRQLSWPDTP